MILPVTMKLPEWYRMIHPVLTHWGQATYICISELTIIGSDAVMLPGWHQAIMWTNAGILLIGPMGTSFSEILMEIFTFSLKKMDLKMLSGKWGPFCFSLNVSNHNKTQQSMNYKHELYVLGCTAYWISCTWIDLDDLWQWLRVASFFEL